MHIYTLFSTFASFFTLCIIFAYTAHLRDFSQCSWAFSSGLGSSCFQSCRVVELSFYCAGRSFLASVLSLSSEFSEFISIFHFLLPVTIVQILPLSIDVDPGKPVVLVSGDFLFGIHKSSTLTMSMPFKPSLGYLTCHNCILQS